MMQRNNQSLQTKTNNSVKVKKKQIKEFEKHYFETFVK